MKNYEKYEDEIRNYESSDSFCNGFVKPYILKSDHCNGTDCTKCRMLQAIWLLKDYEEPEVDWSKIEVDTPILVRNSEDEEWRKRYFAKYDKYGFVYTWRSGRTSWTEEDLSVWGHAKLAEDEERGKEPEVDWNKVKVDTPILVRQGKNGEWLERHFAKYENGDVYAWVDGQTSWTGEDEIKWKYVKLAENEETK